MNDDHPTKSDDGAPERNASPTRISVRIGAEDADLLRGGYEFDPARIEADAAFTGSVLRPLALMIEPNASARRIEEASGRGMRATAHDERDVLLTTRELNGRVMASAHLYTIRDDLLTVDVETMAFLLKDARGDRCYEWAGPVDLLAELAEYIDNQCEHEGTNA